MRNRKVWKHFAAESFLLPGNSANILTNSWICLRLLHEDIVLSNIYPYLVQLMVEYVFTPFGAENAQIKSYADAIYYDSVKTNNYEAICVAIYFSLKYKFQLSSLDIQWVIKKGNCILLLMTCIYYLKLNDNKRKASQLKPLLDEAKRLAQCDMGRYWLFCYEVLTHDNLEGEWILLKKSEVSFLKNLSAL